MDCSTVEEDEKRDESEVRVNKTGIKKEKERNSNNNKRNTIKKTPSSGTS
jgi:hypothetical protein